MSPGLRKSNRWREGSGRGDGGSNGGSNGGGRRSQGGTTNQICFTWRDNGCCRFGKNCKFLHTRSKTQSSQTNSSALSALSRNQSRHKVCLQFVKLLKDMPPSRLDAHLRSSEDNWKRCWEIFADPVNSSTVTSDQQHVLIQSLAKIPPSSTLDPPPISSCTHVIINYAKKLKNSANDDHIVTTVEVIQNATSRLLSFEWDCEKEVIQEALTKILSSADECLKKTIKEHRIVSSKLMKLIEETEKPWKIRIKSTMQNMLVPSDAVTESSALSFSDWRKATVDWLSTPEFFTPAKIPKMKTPTSRSCGVYESREEYMNTVLRLWVAMTFRDGFVALSPQCRCRTSSGQSCQQTLWPISNENHTGNMKCRTINCDVYVEFSCRIRNHDALCRKCMTIEMANNRGSPGRKASTHIYDGSIDFVHESEGRLYINSFQSRNPPHFEINWRSTKRLSTPNLVGVVKLTSRCVPLRGKDIIHWGEIVFHTNPRCEDKMRKEGKLAINMMSVKDFEFDEFKPGDNVAIIDCMTFCPEWVPVLKALEQQNLESIPFDDGCLLNIGRRSELLIATNQFNFDELGDLNCLIKAMVHDSSLDPIREIRRDEQLCLLLCNKLTKLVKETTLDKTQLMSFVNSLSNPVHLTQGPPGTGKSYLGVVLVRGLMIIRDLWVKRNTSVGLPPILVLSYKNHAIDEFLCDLIQAESAWKLQNKLVRIGGQSNNPLLKQFSERSISLYDKEVQYHRNELESLYNARDSIERILNASSLFLAYKSDIFTKEENLEEDERMKQQNVAAYEATQVLSSIIARVKLIRDHLANDGQDEKRIFKLLSLNDNDTLGVSTSKHLRPDQLLSMIPLLKEGVMHYPNMDAPEEVLYKWIRGQKPVPICNFILENQGCENFACSPQIPLCSHHLCRYNGCCSCVVSDGLHFCLEHLCEAEDCGHSKIENGELYCRIHACKRCIELGKSPFSLAIDDPPRNTCTHHPMCLTPGCFTYCSIGISYCEEHTVNKCCAKTRRGYPCSKMAISRSRPYCVDHIHWMHDNVGDEDSSSEESSLDEPKLCAATTKKKKPCKGHALPGSKYCYDHTPTRDTYFGTEMNKKSKKVFENEGKLDINSSNAADKSISDNPSITAINMTTGDDNLKVPEYDPLITKSIDQSLEDNDESFVNIVDDRAEYEVVDNHDEIEFEPEAENLQHLIDVFELDEKSTIDEDEKDIVLSADTLKFEVEGEENFHLIPHIEPEEWSWEWDLPERWDACLSFITIQHNLLKEIISKLKTLIAIGRKNLHQSKVKASARVYENRSIIGGTMVGCIARLEAIRSCKPFAVVVEEASEVLEPLLFSCLCSSTVKLEMIGDHLQLQPSVMDRREFELVNHVNNSMFQRLIQAPSAYDVSSDVLATQRRMRKNICDLTRHYYQHIVNIQDHPCTSTQTIGMRNSKTIPNNMINASTSEGREVPGVRPHIYLWTHDGKQEKARVGLSRINPQEAEMAVSLASYLSDCGVPKPSIIILTPYKGQLMFIRNLMMNDDRYRGKKLLSKMEADSNSCRLSTVDRFQGDEGDVIIGSLVVDKKSRTPFVKLVNRMIVLLSRARLAMYILGNLSYFKNDNNDTPEHWSKTFKILEQPSQKDDQKSLSYEIFDGACVGNSLPLCCPIHRDETLDAASAELLKVGFCKAICQETLSCGHLCSLPCHWPKLQHNSKCSFKLSSPCKKHPEKITCTNLYKTIPKLLQRSNWEEAIQAYTCPRIMDVNLCCGHVIKKFCWEETNITNGTNPMPECHADSPIPYVYPNCKHTITVTCKELHRYNDDESSAPLCHALVPYVPPCGHSKDVSCNSYTAYSSGKSAFTCCERVQVNLPRCGHGKKVTCAESILLDNWSGLSCVEVDRVIEGVSYGPRDHDCQKLVTFVRNCGHESKEECNKAFELAKVCIPCTFEVEAINRFCGHHCTMSCNLEKKIRDIPAPASPISKWQEGKIPRMLACMKSVQCKQKVEIERKCGHVSTLKCYQVTSALPICNQIVSVTHPICGHPIDIKCCLQDFSSINFLDDDALKSIIASNSISNESVCSLAAKLHRVSDIYKKSLFSCDSKRNLILSCGHMVSLPCKEILRSNKLKCSEKIQIRLSCGHHYEIKCWQKNEFEAGKLNLICQEPCEKKCWNYKCCGNVLVCKCKDLDRGIACSESSNWTCKSGRHSFNIKQCSGRGLPKNCPSCSSEDLKRVLKIKKFPVVFDLSPCFMQLESSKIMNVLPSRNDTFLSRLMEMFSSLFDDLETKHDPFKRHLFHPQIVPCFLVLDKNTMGMEEFNLQMFVKKSTMHGISLNELCASNCRQLSSKMKNDKDLTILVGVAVCCRTFIGEMPKKRKLREIKRKELVRDGYDSMSYADKNLKMILCWEPYALVATHKIRLSKEDLSNIENYLDRNPISYNLGEASISFISPPKDLLLSKIKPQIVSNEEIEDIDGNEINMMKVQDILKGSPFEKMDFIQWSSGSLCSNGVIPHQAEKELFTKMKFTNPEAKPFAGKKLIENMMEVNKSPFLNLLLALEIESFSPKEALDAIKDYIINTQKNHDKVHPWALIAFSRLDRRWKKDLLHVFSLLYPDDSESYMRPDELDFIEEKENEETLCIKTERSEDELEKWQNLQEMNPEDTKSDAMEKLLNLTGLKKVKSAAISLYTSALQLNRIRNEDKRKSNMMSTNYCFLGNPGVGKTTVARLFAQILYDSGLRETGEIVETTAQQLKDAGSDKFNKMINKATGGCLFIDEAYDLDPNADFKGKPIVNELLTLCEDNRDTISVILAGYEDDFNEKLFSYNNGLKSRFESILFEDFDENELLNIWNQMLTEKGWKETPGVASVCIKRLLKQAGRKGFGNARQVRKSLEQSIQRAMVRLGEDFDEDTMILEVQDVIGEDPRNNIKLKSLLNDFEQKIGWGQIKSKINELVELSGNNYYREMNGQPPYDVFLNRMFLGNPGTGKTSCAKLYGKLLKHLGFLSIGDVVEKTAGDFKGSAVGESETKTISIIEGSRGKVLLIDEAYALNDKTYGSKVLDTLVEKVQNTSSDDIAVILIGYEEPMLDMIRNQNPGLARRFPKEYAFYFDDYDENELLQILQDYLERNDVKYSVEFLERALDILEIQRAQSNFGNAGSVQLLVKGALQKLAVCGSRTKLEPQDLDDPGSNRAKATVDPLDLLDKLYRMEEIKKKIGSIRDSFIVAKREGNEIPKLGHFVFLGNPGTGKTTVARVMADILFSLGLIPTNIIQETTGLDLTGDYVGQTKTKVNETLKKAKGGCLFIDEAYNLAFGPYGKEACDTLVAAMTSEEFKDVVIIIAGYDADINKMLQSNAGLKSRFNHFISFPNWEVSDCLKFFMKKGIHHSIKISEQAEKYLLTGFHQLLQYDGFGNGRDVEALWQISMTKRASRVVSLPPEFEKSLQLSDVNYAMKEMIESRTPKSYNLLAKGGYAMELPTATCTFNATTGDPSPEMERTKLSDFKISKNDVTNGKKDMSNKVDNIRDDGVSDEIWNELQEAKEKEILLLQQSEDFIREKESYEKSQMQAQLEFEHKLEDYKRHLKAKELAEVLRQAKEIEEKRKETERQERLRKERQEQERQEKIALMQRIQEKLKQMSPCPMGFKWHQCGGGWRCAGGSHFVTDKQLKEQFMF